MSYGKNEVKKYENTSFNLLFSSANMCFVFVFLCILRGSGRKRWRRRRGIGGRYGVGKEEDVEAGDTGRGGAEGSGKEGDGEVGG